MPIPQSAPGQWDTPKVEREVRKIIAAAIAHARKSLGKSRDDIAREMAQEIGRTVTPSMLRDFTRSATKGRQVRFPAAWVPAFCIATGDDSLQRLLLSEKLLRYVKAGEDVLNSKDLWDALAPALAKRWVRQLREARRAIAANQARAKGSSKGKRR